MRLTLTMPHNTRVSSLTQEWEQRLGGRDLVRIAQHAEALGFDKMTVGEHLLVPEEHLEMSGPHYMQTTTALGFLAGATTHLRVGSHATLIALQNPIVQAKQWAVLDWLSDGRAECLIGAGWMRAEFDTLRVPFDRRGTIIDEYVQAMIALWTEPLASFDGEFIEFHRIASEPKPVQRPHIPLGFAGDRTATLRRVAKWGTTWSPFQTPPESIRDRLDELRGMTEYGGQDITVSVAMSTLKLADGHRPKPTHFDFDTWNAQEFIDIVGWLAEQGATEVSPTVPAVDSLEHYLERLEWISAEVMPAFR